ncbi:MULTISPECIES: RNA-directed DNA polymerase [unclassified Mesorhizobium]|uniref:RNA-directed DNA polymerase n=1 Tax=unclassified Mesorhizobium TaxID=325217 RepID=UPI00333B6BBF
MKLDRNHLEYALNHIVENGDTDIFPYPFELSFLKQNSEKVIDELSALDMSSYQPMSLVESLVPKTKFGFRNAHQPFPVDTLLFTALVTKISDAIEAGRDDPAQNRAFSYRKSTGLASSFFINDRSFRNWLEHLQSQVFSDEFSHAIRADISDFYLRIYRHRLENILDSVSGDTATVKRIERFLSVWRGGQSFGLPVGSDASRLLAEASLNDIDMAMISEDYWHTRYVDDFVILVKKGQDPYAVLAFLAQSLSANEGLSLNNQKTKIFEWDEFMGSFPDPTAEDEDSKEHWATEKLFWAAYGQDELDPEALAALTMKDLSKELEEQIAGQFWDMGSIRIILHAMRLVENPSVSTYIRNNLSQLVPFAKDVCLLIEHFHNKGIPGFEDLGKEIVELLLSPRMRPLDSCRAWFLELGVRNIVNYTLPDIRKLDSLSGILDIRQLHLLRWRANDINYFRSRKSRVNEIQAWAQPSFIFGARCLPRDEYSHWVRAIKSRLQFPLGKVFADWCLDTYGRDPLVA